MNWIDVVSLLLSVEADKCFFWCRSDCRRKMNFFEVSATCSFSCNDAHEVFVTLFVTCNIELKCNTLVDLLAWSLSSQRKPLSLHFSWIGATAELRLPRDWHQFSVILSYLSYSYYLQLYSLLVLTLRCFLWRNWRSLDLKWCVLLCRPLLVDVWNVWGQLPLINYAKSACSTGTDSSILDGFQWI